jgi:hypothetical protein
MKTKKDRYSTANNSKVGDVVQFLQIPYFQDDLRMFWIERVIKSIELSKTGKRVKVNFEDGYVVDNIAPNTTFSDVNDKFMQRMESQRGWRLNN